MTPELRSDEAGALDEALTRLAPTGPEYAGGLSNHGPMVAMALVQLGRADAISGWLDAYVERLEAAPPQGRVLGAAEQREALGVFRRYGDWQATYRAALTDAPWRAVVAGVVPRLFPGAIAAGTHGVIRTGHAVRALVAADTAERRAELADALAYWSATFAPLGDAPRPAGGLGLVAALAAVPFVAEGNRGGMIGERALAVGGVPAFAAAVDELAPPADADAALVALGAEMARWYLANREQAPVSFAHTVTAPAAARHVAGVLAPADRPLAFACVWQACAAVRATAAVEEPPTGGADLVAADRLMLAERALEIGGAHAIKLAEACLDLGGGTVSSALPAAALDAVGRLRV